MTARDNDFDLGTLDDAMNAATPRPDPARQARTQALARTAFAAHHAGLQRSRDAAEPHREPGKIARFFRRLTTTAGLAGMSAASTGERKARLGTGQAFSMSSPEG